MSTDEAIPSFVRLAGSGIVQGVAEDVSRAIADGRESVVREKDAVGAYGERVAAHHLVREGMQILDRNWRCRDGEIDIIARDAASLVFCEVKTRRTVSHGLPVEAVVAAKARRLRRLAVAWLATHDVHAPEIRFDVIGVMPRRSGAAAVEHLRGAF